MVEISREERDAYLIPQNFVDTGTILGGTVKLRNAVEAAVLAVGSAIPLFYLPMAFNIRLMIVIAVSVPLGVFGVVGIGGDSLTQFVAHWFRFMKRRRIVTPTPQGNLEANRHRHLRLISKRYRVVYYDDSDTLPHNAQVLQRKADRHGKLVKRQTLYDLLPIEKIENGILHTTDDRYIKILEIEPINFLLRSPREQRSVIYSFASLLKVSPVRLQFKSFSRKADVNAYLDKLRRDAANEPDAAVRKRHMSYIRFVKRLGSRDAVSRRFFVIFQYEAPTNERNISYAEIVSTLETTARNFRTYLAQCGNAIVEHENEDEFITDVFYTLLNRRTAVQVPLQERIQDVLASYLAQNDATALDKIPPAAFMIPPSLDLKHGRYLYMDGISKADMTDGRELPGAKLKITDANGSSIAEWETNGQPHRIERLKPGEYTLTETAAPAGYLLSEEVRFTVQETGEIQKVTMYDAPAHSLIFTKRDIATNAKLVDARLTIRDAYGTTIDRWTTTDGDHAIRVLPERSAAKDPRKNLLLLSDDTSEHVYTMVEELAPDGYLVAESITFKVMQMNDALVVFVWQDGGWQKSSEGYLAMYDERTNTPMPLMKTFPQTGSIS
ncbi:hypothetical protein L3K78_00895 [Oscillospiraceae bacterium SCCA1]|nr:hypothetical protein [Oscillospiraceae bacterium SCCA1]